MTTIHIGYSVDGMISIYEEFERTRPKDKARTRTLELLRQEKAKGIKFNTACPTPTEPEPGVFECPGHPKEAWTMQCQEETAGRQIMVEKGRPAAGRRVTDSRMCRNKATHRVSLFAGDMVVCWLHAREAEQHGLLVAALKPARKETPHA